MKYLYPVIFTPGEKGMYFAEVPDLPYINTYGKNIFDAFLMAEDAIEMWLAEAEDKKEAIPPASPTLDHTPPSFVSFVLADTVVWRKKFKEIQRKRTQRALKARQARAAKAETRAN
ncbi:hypothetical protein FACS1894219_01630 [Clostridia bacterium]|nr:hypothetical protein FACS1894219_01630 [Clostridia bacterium]